MLSASNRIPHHHHSTTPTNECSTPPQGEYVTILIGYNDAVGKPAAGIMYRPLTQPVTWAAGAASEDVVMGVLDMARLPIHTILFTPCISHHSMHTIRRTPSSIHPPWASSTSCAPLPAARLHAHAPVSSAGSKYHSAHANALSIGYAHRISTHPACANLHPRHT